MRFEVVGNELRKISSYQEDEQITSNSYNYSKAEFTFSDEWDSLNKLVEFKRKNESYEIILSGNQCYVPKEILEVCAPYSIGVIGSKDTPQQIATNYCIVKVIQGTERGESAEPPTPGVYDQILDMFHTTEEIANSVREDADAHKFDGCGIKDICCTGHHDNVDVYTITLDDGRTYDYEIISAPSGEVIDFSVAKYLDNHPGIFDVKDQIESYLRDHPPIVDGEMLELTNRF